MFAHAVAFVATAACILITERAAISSEIHFVSTESPVTEVYRNSRGNRVRTENGIYRLHTCPGEWLCLSKLDAADPAREIPAAGLPDGGIAVSGSGDIRRAWYEQPTARYRHGVLGDTIEAGALQVRLATGETVKHILSRNRVFEDLTPRIADLDGDGENEVITIRSSLTQGSAVAIYAMVGGKLQLKAESREIGRPNRWLNIAGIGNFANAGEVSLAWVETPHIGGKLKIAQLSAGELLPVASDRPGFSNHVIGSRALDLSAVIDPGSTGLTRLALPSSDRSQLKIVDGARVLSIPLPGRVAHNVLAVGRFLVTATDRGQLLAIVP